MDDLDHDKNQVAQLPVPEMLVFQDWEGIVVDGAFHVRDVALAKKLGFDRPRKIRELIERHKGEIEQFGLTPQRGAPIVSGKGRVTEVQEYYLNERQALVIVRHSATPNADAIYAEMMDVFLRYKRGELTSQPTNAAPPRVEQAPAPSVPTVASRRFGHAIIDAIMDREDLITSASARDAIAIEAARADMVVRQLEDQLSKARRQAVERRAAVDEANTKHNAVNTLVPTFDERYPNQPSFFRDQLARLSPETAIVHAVLDKNDDDTDKLRSGSENLNSVDRWVFA
jgi:hypothetical protein